MHKCVFEVYSKFYCKINRPSLINSNNSPSDANGITQVTLQTSSNVVYILYCGVMETIKLNIHLDLKSYTSSRLLNELYLELVVLRKLVSLKKFASYLVSFRLSPRVLLISHIVVSLP